MKNFAQFFIVAVVIAAQNLFADESLLNLYPPKSAEDLPTVFELGMAGKEEPDVLWDDLFDQDSLKLRLRNYYFNRDRPSSDDSIAWAQGGSLEYTSGKIAGIFSMSAEYWGSFRLWGPDRYDGTLLLEPGQDTIDVLGVANARFDIEGNVVSLYRQKYDLPYLNQQDNRMVPNTFEGYTIGMPKTSNERFQYVAGYIDRMKQRDSDTFISMSDAAGVIQEEHGLLLGGVRYYPIPELSVAAIDLYSGDIINYFYSEAVHKTNINDELANNFSMQFSAQNSVGDDLLRGENYSGTFWGAQEAISYRHAVFKAGFNQTDSGMQMKSPYGSHPSYACSLVEDFNRAGESAWIVGLSYDFGLLGLKDLSLSSMYVSGSGARDEITKNNIADRSEADVTLDYRVSEGALKGFWVRLRSATVTQENSPNTYDYRIIVNYEIPLISPAGSIG